MPYKNDPRRTVTLNLPPAEYAVLAQDALDAGYATPGTYALALVRARGETPAPLVDERTEERFQRLAGRNAWLLHQFEAQQDRLAAAGLSTALAHGPDEEPVPRSWPAQQRAIDQAVAAALAQERAQVARRARQASSGAGRTSKTDKG